MTVLDQALALVLRSNFFLRFLRGGDFLEEYDSETPGNSPCFQCLLLTGEEEEGEGGGRDFLVGAANAQRTMRELESEEDERRMGEREMEG